MDINTAFDSPGIGDNQPPPAEAFRDRIDRLLDVANRWLKERPVILDEDMAAKCIDFLDQIGQEAKAVEEQRRAEKKPHDEAGRAVDAKYKPLTALLDTAKTMLKPRLTVWLNAKELRRQAAVLAAEAAAYAAMQEVARLEAEAAKGANVQAVVAAEDAAAIADAAVKQADAIAESRAQVRGDYSTRARSLRGQWKAELTSMDDAFRFYRNHPDVRETLEKLANKDARGGARVIPGFTVWEEKSVA